MQGGREQRSGEVVQMAVIIPHRAGRMLVSRRAEFGTGLPGQRREVGGVEIHQPQSPCRHDDVFRLEVSVCPVAPEHGEDQPVERRGQEEEPFPVAGGGSADHGIPERRPLIPRARDHIGPLAPLVIGVDEKLAAQEPPAVKDLQMGHRPGIALEHPRPSRAAHLEDHGAVPNRIPRPPVRSAAHLRIAEGAHQAIGVFERTKVLRHRAEHGWKVILKRENGRPRPQKAVRGHRVETGNRSRTVD